MLISLIAILVLGAGFFVWQRVQRQKALPKTKIPIPEIRSVEDLLAKTPSAIPLTTKLGKTRSGLASRLGKFLGAETKGSFSEAEWEEMEEALLEGDVGVQTTTLLLEKVRQKLKTGYTASLGALFRQETVGLLDGLAHGVPDLGKCEKPFVISIVGINGVGKTTTIGKLAQYFKGQGKSVLLGAGDTFRAGAIAQLKVWSDRVGTDFITGREGADPGAVAFDTVTAAKARGVDVAILDTAGRLHTKSNLMDELKKVHRVVKKVIPEAPHEVWLVIDGTLGQNSLNQAREFKKALDVTGLIVTKLDGTAKGGSLVAIASELQLPIRFIGVGEAVEDLIPFESKTFVDAIFG